MEINIRYVYPSREFHRKLCQILHRHQFFGKPPNRKYDAKKEGGSRGINQPGSGIETGGVWGEPEQAAQNSKKSFINALQIISYNQNCSLWCALPSTRCHHEEVSPSGNKERGFHD
jgi:hypothetical protein